MRKTLLVLISAAIILAVVLIAASFVQTATSPVAIPDGRLNAPPAQVSADLHRVIGTGLRDTAIPGIQVGISTPQWTWDSAAGNASPITGEPARPGMRFLIASVSKTFTSVAVQKLAEKGKLSLDDNISVWLPADLVKTIPNGDEITVRQLLDHTSGIADYDESAINLEEYQNPDTPVPYQAGLMQGLNASPLYPPGTNYTYSNVNYILLTLIVDKAAGVPYEDYVTREIFVPAGLNDTFFETTNHIPGPHMTATMPGENGTILDFTNLYVLFDRGAGDMVSTTADLNRFHRALREGKLINKSSLAAMEKPTQQSGAAGYGLGYATERVAPANLTVQGHTGGYPGSFTFLYYLPEKDTYVTFNLNSAGGTLDNLRIMRTSILTYLSTGSVGVPAPVLPSPSVNMTVPFAPVPVASRDGINIAYELELSPVGGQTFVPDKVEVIDPSTGEVLYSADGELLAALYHPASNPLPSAAEIRNGTGKVSVPRISLWFTVRPGEVPDRLVHRLTISRSPLPPVMVTGGEVTVRKNLAPVVIGPPMHGAGWLAMETTAPTTHHFLAQITKDGVTRVPQRYAQDWILVDPVTGIAATGNVSLAKNYLGYGQEIYSVADGTVVDVFDGIPDNELIYDPPAATPETLAGNYVIVDIGNKKYACYAHMVPGSIRVKKGDTVREGQVLGRMGNSGNSDLPHLHFQVVTDTPSFLGAEGYPHVYRSFDVIGGVNMTRAAERQSDPSYTITQLWSEFGDFVMFSQQPMQQVNKLPENNAIVRFP
jgi:D-alanyl-D-alanine carboxypeptidase